MDWTNNNPALLFARVQNAAHVRTSIIYGVIFAIHIMDADEMTFQPYGDAVTGGHLVRLSRFYESRRFSTLRCCLTL